jgi:glucose/arabinose dehydrogenase
VLSKLGIPTNFVWTPDGSQLLVSNKGRQLYVFDNPDGDDSYSNQTTAIDLSSVMCDNSERGLSGVAVHPEFATNRFVYLYFTYNKNNNCDEDPFIGPVNRLSRFVLPPSNIIDVNSEEVFFETPSLEYDHHNSGDIAFGKDGHLYVTVGDGGSTFSAVAQNLGNIFGTIVRLTGNNEIPSTNPFTFESGEFKSVRCNLEGLTPPGSPEGAVCQEIFAYGLRNPFKFAMDPNTEDDKVHFYINDVGQASWGEIDEGGHDFAGANYGWPAREGPCPISKDENCDDAHPFYDPAFYYYHNRTEGAGTGSCVTGGAFVPNGLWATELDGSYIFGEYVDGQLYLMRPSGGEAECRSCNPPTTNRNIEVITSHERILNVAFGPYNDTQALYYSSSDGTLHRVTYLGAGNRSPEAVILANPTSGPVGVTVQFSAAGSSDFEGDILSFAWDFDGDGVIDSTMAVDSYTYSEPGVKVAELTVSDGQGGKRVTTIEISVGNKPVPVIENPPEGATFSVGDILTLTGSATDEETGSIPDSSLVWEVRQHHNTHYHPFLDLTNGNNIALQPAPEPEDYDAAKSSYLEIILTATDADGLTTTVTRNVQPWIVLVDFDTEPSGLDIVLDGSPFTTPGSATTWEGHTLRVDATNQGDGINSYLFDSWSDGILSQGREILILPALDVQPTFVARFVEVSGTFSPTGAPTKIPKCQPQALLIWKQVIQDGNFSLSEVAGVFIEQRNDGILAVLRGTPDNPGETIWQSLEEGGPIGPYYTRMGGAASVITKGGTPENKTDTVWRTKSAQIILGDYFFGISCDGLLSIYQGTAKNPGQIVWNAEATPSPTSFPSRVPTITMSPTMLPGDMPTMTSSHSPTTAFKLPVSEPSMLRTKAPVVPPVPDENEPPTSSSSSAVVFGFNFFFLLLAAAEFLL